MLLDAEPVRYPEARACLAVPQRIEKRPDQRGLTDARCPGDEHDLTLAVARLRRQRRELRELLDAANERSAAGKFADARPMVAGRDDVTGFPEIAGVR